MGSDERVGGAWRCSLLFAVVILNIILPNLVLSYGIFVVHWLQIEESAWLGLATPTIFIITYSFTQCWSREAADSWGDVLGYRSMATIGLFLIVISLILSAFIPLYTQSFVYGCLGGLGSSLISAQVDAVVFDTYDTRLRTIRALCFIGQAVGQCLFPHLISALINIYGLTYSFIVLAGIMLQTLPGIMMLKIDDSITRHVTYSRYSDLAKTYRMFSNDRTDNCHTDEVQLNNLNKKCWKSPSDPNLHRESFDYDNIGNNDSLTTITPPPSPEEKRKNIFGVDILPEIPEESEDSEYDDQIDTAKDKRRTTLSGINRLSILGDSFEDYIQKQTRNDSLGGNEVSHNVEVTYDNISPITYIRREKVFNTFSFRCRSTYATMKRKMTIPTYKVYRLRRRFVYIVHKTNDTFIKPLTRSLSNWRFYPAVLLCFAKLSMTAITLVFLPLIAFEVVPLMSITEMNFLMSLHGFTWICFLLSIPWLVTTPKRNFKYVAVFGLFVGTASCYVLAEAKDHDTFSIGCIIAGLGYGAITSSWEATSQDFVGPHKWSKLHSTLEILAACLLGGLVYGLSVFIPKTDIQYSFRVLGLIFAFVTVIWFVIAIVSAFVTRHKNSIRRNRLV